MKKQPAMMFGTFTAHCITAVAVEAGRGALSVARMAGVMQDELYSSVPTHTITAPACTSHQVLPCCNTPLTLESFLTAQVSSALARCNTFMVRAPKWGVYTCQIKGCPVVS